MLLCFCVFVVGGIERRIDTEFYCVCCEAVLEWNIEINRYLMLLCFCVFVVGGIERRIDTEFYCVFVRVFWRGI